MDFPNFQKLGKVTVTTTKNMTTKVAVTRTLKVAADIASADAFMNSETVAATATSVQKTQSLKRNFILVAPKQFQQFSSFFMKCYIVKRFDFSWVILASHAKKN